MVNAYLKDTVTREVSGGLDSYGERQAPATTTDAVQLVWKTQIVRAQDGSEVVSAGHIVTKTAYGYGDAVIVNGTRYSIASIEEIRLFSQAAAYRVYLR